MALLFACTVVHRDIAAQGAGGPTTGASAHGAQAVYDALLRAVQDSAAPATRRLVRPGVSLSIDFAGLDSALGPLGLARDHDLKTLQRYHPRVRLEPFTAVTECGRRVGGGERCVVAHGVLSLRFFAPRRVDQDELVMDLGQYETSHAGTVTGGVHRVWLRRAATGWYVARVEGLVRS